MKIGGYQAAAPFHTSDCPSTPALQQWQCAALRYGCPGEIQHVVSDGDASLLTRLGGTSGLAAALGAVQRIHANHFGRSTESSVAQECIGRVFYGAGIARETVILTIHESPAALAYTRGTAVPAPAPGLGAH